MVIDILFMKLERSEAKEVLLATYDLLGENEKGAIFRDSYGMVIKESPGHIILEVSDLDDDTVETVLCFWKDGSWQKVS